MNPDVASALAAFMVWRIYDRWRVGSELVSELRTGFKRRVDGYFICGQMDWRRP